MLSKMIWANFSVQDVARSRSFYTQLGFKPNGRNDNPQLASFCFGADDFVIHFFASGSRIDQYLEPGAGRGSEIIFTLSATSEAEIRAFAEKVVAAGGTIFRQAGRDEDNYYGLGFADPDGHKFNVLLMEAGM